MSVLRLPNGRSVRPGTEELGTGLRSMVRSIAGTDVACMKIYFDGHAPPADRLQALSTLSPVRWTGDRDDHLHVAWPQAPLLDETGAARAVVMPRVTGVTVQRLLDAERRAEFLAEPTWGTNLVVAERLARLLHRLHRIGVVIGDLTPSNVLVNRFGYVTLIDCDTVQFTDPGTGRFYPSSEFTPEYAAPEVLAGGPPTVTAEHDLFALAVMVCELLLEGQHPFEGVPVGGGGTDGIEGNIRQQRNWITHPHRMVPRADLLPPKVLPPGVLDLVRRSFGAGHTNPAMRPAAALWAAGLQQAAFELMGCRHNPMHSYHRSLAECVWCDRVNGGQPEQFPVPGGWRPTVPLRRSTPAHPTAPMPPSRPPATPPSRPRGGSAPPPSRPPAAPSQRTAAAQPAAPKPAAPPPPTSTAPPPPASKPTAARPAATGASQAEAPAQKPAAAKGKSSGAGAIIVLLMIIAFLILIAITT
jgi:DNA-binding helix-hairpin-helix protein with protein kinase domain